MARKVAVALAGLAASLTLAVGLSAAGFAPSPPAPTGPLVPTATDLTPPATRGQAVEPKLVYVKPAPKARTVVRTVTDRPRPRTGFVESRPLRASRQEGQEHEDRHREGHEDDEHESGERESGERD